MWSQFCRWVFRVTGWEIIGRFPEDQRQYVVAAAPHTSGWDFPLGILVRGALEVDIKFIGKKSLFKPPLGSIFRWLGGYPVDRSKRSNFVSSVVDIFKREKYFKVAIAPEGTRKKVDRLKTGFYYIALGAGVPIVPAVFHYGKKQVIIGEPFFPTGDKDKDFEQILNFFRKGEGKVPEWGID